MLFSTTTTVLAALAATISATPLVARNTNPSGSYPVCSASWQVVGKPFYLSVVPYAGDAAYGAGYVQQVGDGQMFVGTNNGVDPTSQGCESATKPFFFFSPNGHLYDNHGRVVDIANGQIQADYGGGNTDYGLCKSNSQLTIGGINTIYACKNGDNGSYRIYTGTQVPASGNANCNVIYLVASYL